MNADSKLDVTGLTCPMPLIQIYQAANSLTPGQTLGIMGDDPIFEESIRDFCAEHGFDILDVSQADRCVTIVIQKT